MKKFYGNYLGLCINNNDPQKRGRVQVFIPHIMPTLYEDWNEAGEDIKALCVGTNIQDSLPSGIVDKLMKILPWAESASPILGVSSPGKLNTTVAGDGTTSSGSFNQSPVASPSIGDTATGAAAVFDGGGTINGASSGGTNGNWAGSLNKLSQILPSGTTWTPSSQKRSKVTTASGNVSDHYTGSSNAYGIDLGLNSSFGGNNEKSTKTALQIVNNVQAQLGKQSYSSWSEVKDSRSGRSGSYYQITPDGYRVQVLWQSDSDHYDHIHIGVKNVGSNSSPQSYSSSGTSTSTTSNNESSNTSGTVAAPTPHQDKEGVETDDSKNNYGSIAKPEVTKAYRSLASIPIADSRVKGIRGNNPGNLHTVTSPYIGQVGTGSDIGGDVAFFDTLGNGIAQNLKQISLNINRGQTTISSMAGGWTGTSGSTAASVAQTWSTYSGIGINETLNYNDKAQMQALLQGISFNESSGVAANFQDGFNEGWETFRARNSGIVGAETTSSTSTEASTSSSATGSLVNNTDKHGTMAVVNMNNMAKGVFAYPAAGALLWTFFQEGDPNFPVYFAASYGEKEWASAFRLGSDGEGYKLGQTDDNTATGIGSMWNLGTGGISVNDRSVPDDPTKDQKSLTLFGYDGSNIHFNEGYHQIFSKFDRRDSVEGDRWETTLGFKEEWVQGDSNEVVMGDVFIKIGNVSPPAVDAVTRIQEIIKECMKPLTESTLSSQSSTSTQGTSDYTKNAADTSKIKDTTISKTPAETATTAAAERDAAIQELAASSVLGGLTTNQIKAAGTTVTTPGAQSVVSSAIQQVNPGIYSAGN